MKFRVWDSKKKEYFKPTFEAFRGKLEEILLSSNGQLMMHTFDERGVAIIKHLESFYPGRYTIEMACGFSDNKGHAIHAGDIVSVVNRDDTITQHEVYWDSELLEFGLRCSQELFHVQFSGDFRIVGNIHDSENETKILNMTLKKEWFDLIYSGEKKEEYREIKPYWEKRLIEKDDDGRERFKQFDGILFKNGYQKNAPMFIVELKSIKVSEGKPEWGATPGERYFVLELGEVMK